MAKPRFMIFQLFMRSSRVQKKRAILTIAAIAWGTLALLLLLAFGEGLGISLQDAWAGMGTVTRARGLLRARSQSACQRCPSMESVRIIRVAPRGTTSPLHWERGFLLGFFGPGVRSRKWRDRGRERKEEANTDRRTPNRRTAPGSLRRCSAQLA